MNVLQYVPIEEPPKRTPTQWSLGIAMFAAFLLPFVLLSTNARYREIVAQATAKIAKAQPDTIDYSGFSQWFLQDD